MEAPLVFCAPRSLTLSSSACAADWVRALGHKPQPWESRWHCRACPIGARCAGVDASAARRSEIVDGVMRLCVRCHRPAAKIVQGRYCVSCYNREREMRVGKNGKGTAPVVLLARYPSHTVVVRCRDTAADGEWHDAAVERVATMLEAILVTLRVERRPLLFGRHG